MVRVRNSEVTDWYEVGKNYTGVDSSFSKLGQPFRYGFVLIRNSKSQGWATNSAEETLPFPPTSITEDEPAATQITYTQNSGRFIERRGQLSKNITLQGTTGFNYNPKYPKITRDFLPSAAIVNGEGPNSGMGRFLRLRNLFREYWEIFGNPNNVELRENAPLMVFVNEKDDERWVVEPMNFRMTRQSPSNKFTYNYEIVLQTIAPVEDVFFSPDDTTLFQKIKNVKNTVRGISSDLSRINASVGGAMAFATGALKEASDAVVNRLVLISDAASSVAEGVQSVLGIPDVIKGSFGVVETSFMQAYEDFQDVGDIIGAQSGENPIPFSVQQDLAEAAQIVAGLSGRDELFNTDLNASWGETLQRYNPAYGFGGYNNLLVSPLSKTGVREVDILPEDDIISLATRVLGNAERFMEIVVLNNLRPPYISSSAESRQPNTLAPGDPVLVPASRSLGVRAPVRTTVYSAPTVTSEVVSSTASETELDLDSDWRDDQWAGFTAIITQGTGEGQSRIVLSNIGTKFTVDDDWDTTPDTTSVVRLFLNYVSAAPTASSNEQVLGVDAKLNTARTDIQVSSTGDVQVISGTENMRQAVDSRIKTMQGELPVHPTYGLAAEPGFRADFDRLVSYKLAVRQSLLADRRVDAIEQLKVFVSGDILEVEAYVLLTGREQPFTVDTRGGQ